jgi:ribosomal protein L31
VKLQCVNRACDYTIVTASTIFHADMYCKCHSFFTHQL